MKRGPSASTARGLAGRGAAGAAHEAADRARMGHALGRVGRRKDRRSQSPGDCRKGHWRAHAASASSDGARVLRQAQHAGRCVQGRQRLGQVERLRAVLLGQLLAVGAQHQRRVQVAPASAGPARAAAAICRGVLSARSSPRTTSVMPCVGVVDHHGELVGPQPVGAAQDEVADLGRHVLLLRAEAPVGPGHDAVRHAQAPARAVRARAGPSGRCRDSALPARARAAVLARPGRPRCPCASRRRDRPCRCAPGGPARPGTAACAGTATAAARRERRPQAASWARMVASAPGTQRGVSTSSMRTSQRPPCARASSQLASAATSEPACSGPVGEGAKRPR